MLSSIKWINVLYSLKTSSLASCKDSLPIEVSSSLSNLKAFVTETYYDLLSNINELENMLNGSLISHESKTWLCSAESNKSDFKQKLSQTLTSIICRFGSYYSCHMNLCTKDGRSSSFCKSSLDQQINDLFASVDSFHDSLVNMQSSDSLPELIKDTKKIKKVSCKQVVQPKSR